jgi:general secretion pathway protein G
MPWSFKCKSGPVPETGRGLARQAAFTLIELLVVLVILGLLIGLVTPMVIGYLSRAKSDVARIQIDSLATALDLYRLDAGSYPSQAQGLNALVRKPDGVDNWNGPYLKGAVPLDPWQRPYIYRPGDRATYALSSLGADGKAGGDGEDADITLR